MEVGTCLIYEFLPQLVVSSCPSATLTITKDYTNSQRIILTLFISHYAMNWIEQLELYLRLGQTVELKLTHDISE
jgi:hypothetical protein